MNSVTCDTATLVARLLRYSDERQKPLNTARCVACAVWTRLNASGSSGGYSWAIRGTAQSGNLRDGQAVQRVTATVTWEGGGNSEVELTTIVPMPKQQVAP